MKQTYTYEVNGFQIHAEYEEKDIETIFIPLLQKWKEMQKKAGRRILVFLSAPPGTGKTTLVQFLEYLSEQEADAGPIQAIGLDGFHYHQQYILTHEACVEGRIVPMKEVKGCPETYDLEKLRAKIHELRKGGEIRWPIYSRAIHDVVEDAVLVNRQIIVLEGNWLLSSEDPWNQLVTLSDDSVFIGADESFLKDRLVDRKMKGGLSLEEATTFCEQSDCRNVRRLMRAHQMANTNLMLQADGTYIIEK